MSQNRSHAVMSQRAEPHDSLDFFPTPAWATRALCELITGADSMSAWDPACGDGAMARPLKEYFRLVLASDIHDYGVDRGVHDFLMPFTPIGAADADWIITNPPFRLGEQFARRAIDLAAQGVALLVRTAFLESVERYKLFTERPPFMVAQFVERVPMVKGRLDRSASTATAYCWIIWRKGHQEPTRFHWIAPCRKQLDRDADWPKAA